MPLDIAKRAIVEQLTEYNKYTEVEIELIGGEVFLKKEFIVGLCEWAWNQNFSKPFVFFITTNGTLIDPDIQKWLSKNSKKIILSLSLDGKPKSHNRNRSNSYSKIDIDFFKRTWPNQPVKMTVSPSNLSELSDNIIYVEELGFLSTISFAYGNDWLNLEKQKDILRNELKKLCDYYILKPDIPPNDFINMPIEGIMNSSPISSKWCGTGDSITSINVDGKKFPCQMFFPTSMDDSLKWQHINFLDYNFFQNEKCENCPIYRICPTCYGMNLIQNNDITVRDHVLCEFSKIRAIATSYLKGIKISKALLSKNGI